MNFRKLNNLTGWAICLIACTVYVLTAEAGGSLWDCGEFVSSCFKVQIPHPPGAPLFVLMGRIFIVLFGNNPLTAAHAVNVMSALASGFTILFLFWTITHFARRIAGVGTNDTLTASQTWSIMGAGVVGALAYTFSDSFWYSAVEGEVYAMSSFFTALVFWAILKWENALDDNKAGIGVPADRWIVFIFFMMGLSIGVHLLNLLTIPAIVMVYYFRKQDTFNYKVIRKWFLILTIIGGFLGMIGAYMGASAETEALEKIAQYLPADTQFSDTTMVGLLLLGTLLAIGGLYFFEYLGKKYKQNFGGTYIFFLIGCVVTGIVQVAVIQYSIKMAGAFDRVFTNSFGLPFFAGFTFFFALLGVLIWLGLRFAQKKGWEYLRLGLWCFTFMLVGYSTYITTMIRSNADPAVDMYNVDNPLSLVGYLGRDQYGDFPLLYGQKFTAQPVQDMETGVRYLKKGKSYEKVANDKKNIYLPKDKMAFPRVWDPSNDQNHADYYAYYLGIEKYKDKEGREHYNDDDGHRPSQADNINFFVGYQCYFMYFRYFMWNFSGKQNDLQGVFNGNVRDGQWITGIPFVDYIMYGSQDNMPDTLKHNKAHNTLFALPFILGLIGMFYQFKRKGNDALVNFLLFFFTGFAIILYLNQAGQQPRERDYAYVGSFYAFAVWIGIGVMAVAGWLRKVVAETSANMIATVICLLAVPVLMASQEWDDHDRSNKQMARDLAKDYLESCPQNAVLFSFGDNDTYPLWYAQEVEGIRKDIRVINYSLLGIDWYINQMRYKVNNSDAIDVIWTAEQIEGNKRNYVRYTPKPEYPDTKYYDLYDIMKNYVGSDDANKVENRGDGEIFNTIPTRKVSVPVDKALILKDSSYGKVDSVPSEIKFDITKGSLYKNDLAVLNIIAANKWKRPICFTSPFGELGFGKFLRKDGMSFTLTPFENPEPNADRDMNLMLKTFGFGNCDKKGVYFDEENRRHLISLRSSYVEFASYLAQKGRKEDARKILNYIDKMLLEENFPYGMASRGNQQNKTSLYFLDACYRAEDKKLAEKVYKALHKDTEQELFHLKALSSTKADQMKGELQDQEEFLNRLEQIKKVYDAPPAVTAPAPKVITDSPKMKTK